jgi:TonB C terminal
MTVSSLRLALLISATMLTSLCATVSWAAPHAPTIALIQAPVSGQPVKDQIKNSRLSAIKRKFARVAAAAICTEDLATISFQEYTADWDQWLSQVTTTWTQAMNSSCPAGAVKPSGPMFVEFTCNRDGSVKEVLIDRSSGDRLCDAMQISSLLKASPLPPFPAESRKSDITLLCIWSYSNQSDIAKTTRHAERPIVRISITSQAQ